LSLNVSELTLYGRGALPLPIMCVQVECLCPADAHVTIAFAVQEAVVVEHTVPLVAFCQKLIQYDWPILLEVLRTFVVLILYSYQFLYNA
jgi:hypothetical protein